MSTQVQLCFTRDDEAVAERLKGILSQAGYPVSAPQDAASICLFLWSEAALEDADFQSQTSQHPLYLDLEVDAVGHRISQARSTATPQSLHSQTRVGAGPLHQLLFEERPIDLSSPELVDEPALIGHLTARLKLIENLIAVVPDLQSRLRQRSWRLTLAEEENVRVVAAQQAGQELKEALKLSPSVGNLARRANVLLIQTLQTPTTSPTGLVDLELSLADWTKNAQIWQRLGQEFNTARELGPAALLSHLKSLADATSSPKDLLLTRRQWSALRTGLTNGLKRAEAPESCQRLPAPEFAQAMALISDNPAQRANAAMRMNITSVEDHIRQREILEIASEAGSSQASRALVRIYRGEEASPRPSSNLSFAQGLLSMFGLSKRFHPAMAVNAEKADFYLERAHTQGDYDASIELAWACLDGLADDTDGQRAITIITELENKKVSLGIDAEVFAEAFWTGEFGVEDKALATAIRLRAVRSGEFHEASAIALGDCYRDGTGGLKQDKKQAAKLYRKAGSNSDDPEIVDICEQRLEEVDE
ncbi:MAG: SEL1-like repeat protein [Maricaulis sp.]|uniref:SEL1-like repeat protein n=1 Tax=Maricaulis sp. TaxID=1486257 RepID=UPI001B0F6C6D|nr:SEL1-like repeat protein [Maricaulis sp.]MBO6847266.1 SEL1-like repeat protein [Maricaulis sp.]